MSPDTLQSHRSGPLATLSWAPRSHTSLEEVGRRLADIARLLREERLSPILIRIYADPAAADEIAGLCRELLSAAAVAPPPEPTLVVNPPSFGGVCAGIHVLALSLDCGAKVRSLLPGAGPGRLIEWQGDRVLLLADDGAIAATDAASLFAEAKVRLGAEGFTFKDVARTWLYVADLLGTYDRLNSARDDAFVEAGLGSPGRFESPPASTGIQGFHPAGHPCFMELVAATRANGRAPFSILEPELQCEAWAYGSSFSRGARLSIAGGELITISGTASISADGATADVGDPLAQILRTLDNITSLLELCGRSARTPGLWTLYFKTPAVLEAWRAGLAEGLIEPVRGPAIFADICRDDLLFEAEVTTIA